MKYVNVLASELHLALEDAAGDSAIIEHLDGKPVVHHGSQYRVTALPGCVRRDSCA